MKLEADASRVINISYAYNKLPFATQAPSLDDCMPLVPGDEVSYPVSTDLITPDMTDSGIESFDRRFTRLGNFGSTIQATCLSSILTRHITNTSKSYEEKEKESMKIDIALQSFGCTLMPPPGMANDTYCGAYSLQSLCVPFLPHSFFPSAHEIRGAFALHEHSLIISTEAGNEEGIARAKLALQSLSRGTIDMTRISVNIKPMDFDKLAFWASVNAVKAALWHIRLGDRDEEWAERLEVLKVYLRWFAPRFGIYGMLISLLRMDSFG